jgi:hypothetical protein
MRLVAIAAIGGLAALGACTGSIEPGAKGGQSPGSSVDNPTMTGGPSNPGNGGGPSGPAPGASVPATPDQSPLTPGSPDRSIDVCKAVQPGPSFLRRLTRQEFDNTIRDLLGEDKHLSAEFPAEELHDNFSNNAEVRTVSDQLAEKYLSASEKIGKAVTGQLGSLLPCDPAQKSDDACLDAFFDGFGKRLWRRPLDSDEKDRLRAKFKENRGASFAEGIDAVVQIMVLSPSFLYRTERGLNVTGTDYQKVAAFEMASRLSYLIWGSLPDADLFKAADANALGTRAEVLAQAERMLKDPRAADMAANFGTQWLALDRLDEVVKDPMVYPDYKPELDGMYRRETEELLKAVWSADAKLETFLTAPYTFMNGTLATLHGVAGVTGADFKKVDLDPKKRIGVMTQNSVMLGNAGADQSSPIKRGLFVQDRLICFQVPDPPANINVEPVVLTPGSTTRERFEQHRKDPACSGCHQFIDPMGFAFEHFDGIGKWRDQDAGKPVDATGNVTGTDVDGPYDGAAALATKLAGSSKVRACVASKWFNYAYGRDATDKDQCAKQTLEKAFEKSGGNFRELVLALTQTDAFMFRSQGVAP